MCLMKKVKIEYIELLLCEFLDKLKRCEELYAGDEKESMKIVKDYAKQIKELIEKKESNCMYSHDHEAEPELCETHN